MAEFNRAKENWCPNCQTAKENKYFIQSLSPVHDGFLPLCRACLTARFKTYKSILNSDGGALWCICSEMSYPVIKKYYDMALEKSSIDTRNLFMIYHGILKDEGFQINGFWQSDIMLDDIIELDTKTDEMAEDKEKAIDLAEQERIWGKFEEEDYELLNRFFDSYTKGIGDLDFSLELRYRDIAKGELRLRKANESGDVGEIDKAQKNLKSLLDMLGLNDYGRKDTDERKQFIDRMAWIIEETEPAEEEDEQKYRDIAGYEVAFANIMRSMKNLNSKIKDYPPVPEEEQ